MLSRSVLPLEQIVNPPGLRLVSLRGKCNLPLLALLCTYTHIHKEMKHVCIAGWVDLKWEL